MAYQPMYNAYAGVPYGYPGYYPQTTAPMGQPTTYQQEREQIMNELRGMGVM